MSRVSAPAAPRNAPAPTRIAAADVDADDDDTPDHQRGFEHRLTTAAQAGVHKPKGAARSVFDLADPDKREPDKPHPDKRKPGGQRGRRPPPLDVRALVIESGVPLPQNPSRAADPGPALLLQRLQEGQSTVIDSVYLKRLMVEARRLEMGLVSRALDDGRTRIWRVPYRPYRQRKAASAAGAAGQARAA